MHQLLGRTLDFTPAEWLARVLHFALVSLCGGGGGGIVCHNSEYVVILGRACIGVLSCAKLAAATAIKPTNRPGWRMLTNRPG